MLKGIGRSGGGEIITVAQRRENLSEIVAASGGGVRRERPGTKIFGCKPFT